MGAGTITVLVGVATAICALCTIIGAVGMHLYKRGGFDRAVADKSRNADTLAATAIGKLELLQREFHKHVADDAAAIAELKALGGENSRATRDAENRMTAAIEHLSAGLADLGRDLRAGMEGLSRRIDGAMEARRN